MCNNYCNNGRVLQARINIAQWPLITGFLDKYDDAMPNQLPHMVFLYIS